MIGVYLCVGILAVDGSQARPTGPPAAIKRIVDPKPSPAHLAGDYPKGSPPPGRTRDIPFVPYLPRTKEETDIYDQWGPFPPWLPFGKQSRVTDHKVEGVVTDADEKSITITVKGWAESFKYPAHILLLTGRVVHWESEKNCYLLADVKEGDEVTLGIGTVVEDDECFYIRIRKRSGGEVPPARKAPSGDPYHRKQQDKNNLDDKTNRSTDSSRSPGVGKGGSVNSNPIIPDTIRAIKE